MNDVDGFRVQWNQPQNIGPLSYLCGRCGHKVGGFQGWFGTTTSVVNGGNLQGRLYVCPFCTAPTFFFVTAIPNSNDVRILAQVPEAPYGEGVAHLPKVVDDAFTEARSCYKAGAYSATALMCRKLLMHVAVAIAGSATGKRFVDYINDLETGGFIAPPSKPWIDKIRALGNVATHELPATSKQDAEMVLDFSGMLLKTLYEYPARATASGTTHP